MLNIISSVYGLNNPGSLGYQNENYQVNWWWWELARVSYVGGQEYLRPRLLEIDYQYPVITEQTDNANPTGAVKFLIERQTMRSLLHRHEREEIWEYENRRNRAMYINFYAPIVNMLVDSVMRKPPTRSGDPTMDAFWDAPDEKREQKMNTMMSHGLRWAQVYRAYHAIVDQKTVAEGGDGKPYMYWVSPLDILDWEVDENGDYVWLKQFISTNVARPTWNSPFKKLHRYRIWYRDRIVTYETDQIGGGQTIIDERPNNLGVIPIVTCYANKNPDVDHPDGVSQMADLPKIANGIFNLVSLVMDMAYKQVFSLLIFPDRNVDKIQIGTSQIVGYDGQNNTGKPEYISPDPDQVRVLIEIMSHLMETARQAVGIGRGRSEGTKQVQSADAIELESKNTQAIMVDIAGAAEDFERRLAKMVDRYRMAGVSTQPAEIQYPREFDIRSLQADVMEATTMRTLGLSPEVMLKLKEDIVSKKFSALSRADLDSLLASLKAMPEPAGIAPELDASGNPVPPKPATPSPFPPKQPPPNGAASAAT